MKLLCFVDTHSNTKAINHLLKISKKVDILVCAGDITNWGEGLKSILKKFEKLKKIMLIIPGNHESEEEMHEACKNLKYVINLHKGAYFEGEFAFFGFGGGGFAMEDKNFEKISKKFFKDAKGKKIILITHAPPFGTKLDNLPGLGHRGCMSIRKFIEDAQPLVHICGHLHETAGSVDKIGKTIIVNPGPHGRIIEL